MENESDIKKKVRKKIRLYNKPNLTNKLYSRVLWLLTVCHLYYIFSPYVLHRRDSQSVLIYIYIYPKSQKLTHALKIKMANLKHISIHIHNIIHKDQKKKGYTTDLQPGVNMWQMTMQHHKICQVAKETKTLFLGHYLVQVRVFQSVYMLYCLIVFRHLDQLFSTAKIKQSFGILFCWNACNKALTFLK